MKGVLGQTRALAPADKEAKAVTGAIGHEAALGVLRDHRDSGATGTEPAHHIGWKPEARAASDSFHVKPSRYWRKARWPCLPPAPKAPSSTPAPAPDLQCRLPPFGLCARRAPPSAHRAEDHRCRGRSSPSCRRVTNGPSAA